MKTPVVDGRGRILSSVKTISGALTAEGINVGIVCGRFNDLITDRLLDGAVDSLQRLGVSPDNVTVAWVPGAFEAPVVARAMANRDDIDGVICLGNVQRCVISLGVNSHSPDPEPSGSTKNPAGNLTSIRD